MTDLNPWLKAKLDAARAEAVKACEKPALDEPVLSDDYPVYGDYLYVADGKVIRSPLHKSTVGELKRREGFKEVRRCDIAGRQAQAVAAAKDVPEINEDFLP